MRRKLVPVGRLAASTVLLMALTACAGSYVTPPNRNAYVPIGPLPPSGSLHDILVRNGEPVGEQDPTTPNDPSVRILHGLPFQAKALFEALSKGGTPVPSTIGRTFRLAGGSTVTYYEHVVEHGSFRTIGNVEIFIAAKDLPVSQLRFYVPPYAMTKCPPGTPCDGGGDM